MIRRAVLSLLALPLAAQIISGSSGTAPTTLPTFLARLSTERPTLVLLDSRQAAWEATFRTMFRKEPLLDLFPLTAFRVLSTEEGVGQQLTKREGWGPEARWLLLASDGRIVSEYREAPSPAKLAEALRDAGWRQPINDLRKALAQRPDLLPLERELLVLLRTRAETRTRDLLGLPDPKESTGASYSISEGDGFGFDNRPTAPDPLKDLTLKDLDTTQDEAIWGDFARALVRHVQGEVWATSSMSFSIRKAGLRTLALNSPFARISPLCREAYLRAVQEVEAALRRVPTAAALWNLWVSLTGPLDRPLDQLLGRITPSPMSEATWPPPFLRLQAMREAMGQRNWSRAEGLVKDHWTRLLELSVGAGGPREAEMNLLTSTQWDRIGQPYVEILLRQARPEDAQHLLDAWDLKGGWKGARARAAVAAADCGLADLAAKWRT
jgi:hypothetical protein